MGLHDREFTGNKEILLAKQMKREAEQWMPWSRWSKYNTAKERGVDPNKGVMPDIVTNAPIIKQKELTHEAGDHLQIPMLRNLIGRPTYGERPLVGHEEKQAVNHADVYVDIMRHAVKPKVSSMGEQTNKHYRLIQAAKPQLQAHYAKASNFLQIATAFYWGFSDNILSSDRFALNANITRHSHPHIFVAGSGKVSYGTDDWPGTAGYEVAVGTAVSAVGSSHLFDMSFLAALAADDTVRRIPYLHTKDGTPYRVIVAHHYQIRSLVDDDDFRELASQTLAVQMAKENPMLVGCRYFVEGWAIFDFSTSVFPVTVDGVTGKPFWGPSTLFTGDLTQFDSYSSNTVFGAIILGDNAMFKAECSGMRFAEETDDYGESKGIAYRIIEGYARPQYWALDEADPGTRKLICDNSAIAVTYAAKPTM